MLGSWGVVLLSARRSYLWSPLRRDVSEAQNGFGQAEYKKITRLVLLLVFASVVFAVSPARSANPAHSQRPVKRVLILDDFSPIASPGVGLINRAIFSRLQKSSYKIELYTENLEATLFSDEASQRKIREWIFRKYHDRKPDVIITVGPTSLKFMIESHESFAPDTPIIFSGSTQEMLEDLKPDSRFTGVWGIAQPEKTLDAALRLQPFTRHVVLVGGEGLYERKLEAIAKEVLKKYESRLDVTYLTDLDMHTLLARLRHLPTNTIIYYTAITQDAAGERFIDATQSVPTVAAAANAPMFIVDDVDLGTGAVGGYLLSLAEEGEIAATLTLRVLNGEKPQDIPAVKSANIYMFDSLALKRWGFRESELPPGSVILNQQPSVWRAFGWYIVGGVSLILAQALLIFGLLWQRSKRRKTENELSITYDRLRLAVESGRSVGWDLDIKSGQNRCFGDLETMFGIQSDTYVAKEGDLRQRVHPEDRELVARAIEDSRQSRKPYASEFRVIREDQTVRWVTARGKFYYAKNGEPELMLGIAVDITNRKQMEQKVRDSEQRLEGIILSAMDAIVAADAEQRIVLFNTAAEEMFCCPAAEAIGKPIECFLRHPDQHSLCLRQLGESVPKRTIGMLGGALRGIRANGDEFPVEASFSRSESEGRELFTIIIRDITARLNAERAVQESERRFRLVANCAPVMIWGSGTDKLYNYFNQQWLDFTGRPLEAELGDGWAEGVHGEDLESCLETYTRSFDHREPFEMQYRLRRHDGEYRWVLDMGVPRFTDDYSFAGYIGSCIDITDRKLAEEALATVGRRLIEAHEEERTRIGRELHDDISQRLALLAIELDRWNKKLPSVAELHGHISKLKKQVSEITDDVRALSHRLHSSHLEYLGLTNSAESFCKEFARQQDVQIEFNEQEMPRRLPNEISLSLFRVLQEALQNAAKHSGARKFRVDLQCTLGQIQLAVRDWGAGFDTRDSSQCQGLGLISMRERVQLVGGHFSIQSQPGIGTTIIASVPLKDQENRAQAA
jgi:PAS domain S-box-containing protein